MSVSEVNLRMKKRYSRPTVTYAVTLLLGTVVSADGSRSALPAAIGGQPPPPRGAARLETRLQNDARVPERLRTLLAEQLMVKENQITYDARFVEDLGVDSLKTVECVLALKEEFSIEVPDEDAEKLLRVGDIVEYLRKRKVID